MTNKSPALITVTFNAKERYSRHLSFLDLGVFLVKLCILSLFFQYMISEMAATDVSWSFVVYSLIVVGYIAITTWQDFRNSYIVCACYKNDTKPARAEIEIEFSNKEEYRSFRAVAGNDIDLNLAQILTDASMQQNNDTRSSIKVDIADVRYRNKTQRAIVRIWGSIKVSKQ